MRTTITFAPDVAAELERLRRERGMGPSDAVNYLVRLAMSREPARTRFVPMSDDMGLRIDVANIGEVLDLLDQDDEGDRAHRTDGPS